MLFSGKDRRYSVTHKLFSIFGNMKFFADGDGDSGGGGEGTPDWQGDHPYFKANPDAAQSSSKYKKMDDYFKGAHEAMTKVGRSFWLPKDHSKLTDPQKEEIRANVAVMDARPSTPDGYAFTIDEGAAIDAQGLADYKVHCHGLHKSNEKAQADLNFQLAFVKRLTEAHTQSSKQMSIDNFNTFVGECGGESAAVLKTEQIKNYLQSKCKDKDGKADPKMWEEFYERISDSDRVQELVLLRALEAPARAHAEAGGGPVGGISDKVGGDGIYAHMK